MYRIACTFEPQHPRIAGRTTRQRTKAGGIVGHVERRGVWRVQFCRAKWTRYNSIYAHGALLWMPSPTPRKVGTLVNPRKVLAEYQQARRQALAVNRVGAVPVLTDEVQP